MYNFTISEALQGLQAEVKKLRFRRLMGFSEFWCATFPAWTCVAVDSCWQRHREARRKLTSQVKKIIEAATFFPKNRRGIKWVLGDGWGSILSNNWVICFISDDRGVRLAHIDHIGCPKSLVNQRNNWNGCPGCGWILCMRLMTIGIDPKE